MNPTPSPATVRTWIPARFPAAGTDSSYAEAVVGIVSSGQFRNGPHTTALEQEAGSFFDAAAVAVGSGMDGLELLMESYGVRGRRVLAPAHCFQAVPALAAQHGGIPVPLPVDPVTLAPPADVAAEPGDLLVWVHHGGIVAGYAAATIARLRHGGVTVIEDCAYVLPTTRFGPGSHGDAAVFSFAPTKPMSGTGGAVVIIRTPGLAAELRDRRTHSGVEERWADGDQLLRWRGLSETDALLALWRWRQHPHIAATLTHVREQYAKRLLSRLPALLPEGRGPDVTWGRYTVDLGPTRADRIQAALAARGIDSSVMTPVPWTDYPALAAYAPGKEQRGLRDLLGRTLALPYHPRLADTDIDRTCRSVLTVLDTKEVTP